MATRLRTALIVVVVVLVAYTGAAWLIGLNVQRQLERYEQQTLTNTPYVVLAGREYHRGIFGATEEVTYRLGGPSLGQLSQALAAAGLTGSSLQLTVRNTIHHGPLPQFRSLALASMNTEIVLPAVLSAKLNAIDGGQSPTLTIHTTMGWLGARTTVISMPTFRAQLPGGSTVIVRGVSSSADTTRNLGSWAGQLVSGGLDVQSPKGGVDLGDIGFDAKMRRVFGSIYVGDANVKLASMTVRGPSGSPFSMKGVSFTSASQADTDYVNYDVRAAADQMSAGNFSFTHVVYAIRLLHLQGASLASLTHAIRQAQASAGSGGAAAAQAGIRDAFGQYGVELLVHDPVIQIQSLAFALPEGEFHLAASLAAHGIRREDLSGGLSSLIALTQHLDATAELRVGAALLGKLVNSSPRGPALSAQLDSLEKQGYLKRDGAAWTAQLAFHGGKLTVNGQPYPPVPGP